MALQKNSKTKQIRLGYANPVSTLMVKERERERERGAQRHSE